MLPTCMYFCVFGSTRLCCTCMLLFKTDLVNRITSPFGRGASSTKKGSCLHGLATAKDAVGTCCGTDAREDDQHIDPTDQKASGMANVESR